MTPFQKQVSEDADTIFGYIAAQLAAGREGINIPEIRGALRISRERIYGGLVQLVNVVGTIRSEGTTADGYTFFII